MNRDAARRQCIEDCINCHALCYSAGMRYPGSPGNDDASVLIACAELCRTTANFMLAGLPLEQRVCELCAEACAACARFCEQNAGLDTCLDACRRCLASCKRMTRRETGAEAA